MSNGENMQDAETVSKRSIEILDRKGWVKWHCAKLDDTITIVNTRLREIPEDCPVYTIKELRVMANADNPVLIHEAVKLGGVIQPE